MCGWELKADGDSLNLALLYTFSLQWTLGGATVWKRLNAAPSDLHNVEDHNDTVVGSSSGPAPGFMAQCRDKVCPCHGPRLIHAEIVHSLAERLHTFRGTNERLDRQCRPLVSSDLSMRQQVLQPWAMVCTKRTLAGRLVLECVFVRSCFELLSPFTGRCGVSGLFHRPYFHIILPWFRFILSSVQFFDPQAYNQTTWRNSWVHSTTPIYLSLLRL